LYEGNFLSQGLRKDSGALHSKFAQCDRTMRDLSAPSRILYAVTFFINVFGGKYNFIRREVEQGALKKSE